MNSCWERTSAFVVAKSVFVVTISVGTHGIERIGFAVERCTQMEPAQHAVPRPIVTDRHGVGSRSIAHVEGLTDVTEINILKFLKRARSNLALVQKELVLT